MSKILVIAAHPDDEILGVGATIAKRVKNGDEAYALIMAEGFTSRKGKEEEKDYEIIRNLHKKTIESVKIIGYKDVFFANLLDNRMDSYNLLDIIKIIENYISDIQPDVIYTHHVGDLNVDHELTSRAVITATRPCANYKVNEIYAFQIPSSTEWKFNCDAEKFNPNLFEDVEDYMEIKCNAMKKYDTELCEFPHPRSIKMLNIIAQYWGSAVGLNMVEAFEVIRSVR